MPYAINMLFLLGTSVVLAGIVIGIYKIMKKKGGFRCMRYTIGSGILISLSSLLISFITHFDIDYSACKQKNLYFTIIEILLYIIGLNLINKFPVNKEDKK